jgi:alpha-beta hydrolase superfamily lysophospholipase
LYADEDPVVSIQSAKTVFEKLGSEHKKLHIIKSDRHGILKENNDNIWSLIDDFLNQQSHQLDNIDKQVQPIPTQEIVS